MNILLIKFNYGEEIICEVQETREDLFYVKNIATLLPTEEMSWHLITWMPYTNVKNGVAIKKSDILFTTELSSEMLEYYKKWKHAIENKVILKDND